ncbi:hypothetical protein J6590_045819 [Homalodisca vitripennis]|nr:hypothetical protein J6590_045819 [Homalodisca vitripennis]
MLSLLTESREVDPTLKLTYPEYPDGWREQSFSFELRALKLIVTTPATHGTASVQTRCGFVNSTLLSPHTSPQLVLELLRGLQLINLPVVDDCHPVTTVVMTRRERSTIIVFHTSWTCHTTLRKRIPTSSRSTVVMTHRERSPIIVYHSSWTCHTILRSRIPTSSRSTGDGHDSQRSVNYYSAPHKLDLPHHTARHCMASLTSWQVAMLLSGTVRQTGSYQPSLTAPH